MGRRPTGRDVSSAAAPPLIPTRGIDHGCEPSRAGARFSCARRARRGRRTGRIGSIGVRRVAARGCPPCWARSCAGSAAMCWCHGRALSSAGERRPYKAEVVGSNPTAPTTNTPGHVHGRCYAVLCSAPRSVRLVMFIRFPLTASQAERLSAGDETDIRARSPLEVTFLPPVCEVCEIDWGEAAVSCQVRRASRIGTSDRALPPGQGPGKVATECEGRRAVRRNLPRPTTPSSCCCDGPSRP